MSTPQEIRDQNLSYLNQHGFQPATWMPLSCEPGDPPGDEPGFASGVLRPEFEIAQRLMIHGAIFAWGSAPSDFGPTILRFVDDNDLRSSMTDDEQEVLDLPKDEAAADYGHMVGWRLENMWALAWTLGLANGPSAISGQLSQEVIDELLALFLPEFRVCAEDLMEKGTTQPVASIIAMEDRFYLAHNAVRSAQLDPDAGTVPENFDPVADGGAIHERRHSLTWALAPGAMWDEVDLST